MCYDAEVKIKGVADTWCNCHSVSNTVFALGVFHSMCLNIWVLVTQCVIISIKTCFHLISIFLFTDGGYSFLYKLLIGFTLNINKSFPKPRIMGSGDGFGATMSWDPRHSLSHCRIKSVKTTLSGTFHGEKSPEEVKTAPWWFLELTKWLHIYIQNASLCVCMYCM